MFRQLLKGMVLVASTLAVHVSAATVDQLRLDLRLNKNTYVFGEPISLEVRLLNLATSPVRTRNVSFSTGLWLLYKHESETNFRYYADPLTQDIIVAEDRTIPPEGHLFSAFIVMDSNRWHFRGGDTSVPIRTLFLAPGKYNFRAKFRVGDEFVHSEIVTVECIAPQGTDLQAWILWQDVQVLATMHGGAMPEDAEQGKNKLRELIERFPSSLYAIYARSRMSGITNESIPMLPSRPPDTKQARTESSSVLFLQTSQPAPTSFYQSALARFWVWCVGLAVLIFLTLFIRKIR